MRVLPTTTLLLAAALGGVAIAIASDDLDISPAANGNQAILADSYNIEDAHHHSLGDENQASPTDMYSTEEPDIAQTRITDEIAKATSSVEQDPGVDILEAELAEEEYLQLMANQLQREISLSMRQRSHGVDEAENAIAGLRLTFRKMIRYLTSSGPSVSDRGDRPKYPHHDHAGKGNHTAEGDYTLLPHQEPSSSSGPPASHQEEPGFFQSVKAALNYPLLEMTITPGSLILAIPLSLLLIEILYRIRAACSRRSRIRRMLGESRRAVEEEADGVFEDSSSSYYRYRQGRQGWWFGDFVGRFLLFSRLRKRAAARGGLGLDGYNGNYGNEAGLGGDKTPPPAYEDYAAHVSDGFCDGNYVAHTTWPGPGSEAAGDEKRQEDQQQQHQDGVEYGEEEKEYDEKAAMVDQEDNTAQEEQEQEDEEVDLMSMSQEIASFRSVADMVSEIVAATAAERR
ncbi:hypothetical protein QBC37DRAFT_34286 [Rhypophila decipiens]|uniref:Uncharacterized protein n=1 Tax=Rhypophila decipiens TaxID=261697 RepID=A0AAN6YEK5_9PEZI|nr:hypothetical protein QBC37DRAFT_34286 [Rhypophila decipiens]